VGFRRAFLRFRVLDAGGKALWSSGETDDLGVIVDGEGKPLPSEFFQVVGGKQAYQPHYEVVSRQDQAQIYEELTQDCRGAFTTSFLSLCHKVKDNRLQPRGWQKDGPFAAETGPDGDATQDCAYTVNPQCPSFGQPSTGADSLVYRIPQGDLAGKPATVEVTLFYQSLPPYYLAQRFSLIKGCQRPSDPGCFPETQRLLYLAANLDTGTEVSGEKPLEDWKLLVLQASAAVP
jgi:hypothetical protein